MFKSVSNLSVSTFALSAMLMSAPLYILALPDILNPEFKTIYDALKARDPHFDAQLIDALELSEREICEMRHAANSPEREVLARRPIRAIGEVARVIKNTCKEDAACIENELSGELGEFIELMLNPVGLRKENTSTNQRFHELYDKHAETLGLDVMPRPDNMLLTTPTASQPQAASVPAPAKTQVNWQPGQNFLQEHDLSAQRLATFMRIVAANVNNQPDEQLRKNWHRHIENAQKDARNLYDAYCPYIITRRLSRIAALGTLGLSRFFTPSFAKCDACDTLRAIIDGHVYREAENKVTMLVKGDADAFRRWSKKTVSQQVAEATKLPMEAMLNPATLASTVIS